MTNIGHQVLATALQKEEVGAGSLFECTKVIDLAALASWPCSSVQSEPCLDAAWVMHTFQFWLKVRRSPTNSWSLAWLVPYVSDRIRTSSGEHAHGLGQRTQLLPLQNKSAKASGVFCRGCLFGCLWVTRPSLQCSVSRSYFLFQPSLTSLWRSPEVFRVKLQQSSGLGEAWPLRTFFRVVLT